MKQKKTTKSENKKAKVIRFFSMCFAFLVMCSTMMQDAIPVHAATPSIYYRSHCQNIGWAAYAYNGAFSGSIGQSLRMESLEIRISGISGSVQYEAHVQNIGWQGWKQNGEWCGTTGQGLRMEAIEIKLVAKSGSQTISNTTLSTALYQSNSGSISCGFDGYKSTNGRHEGIDFVKGYGSAVYSLTDGVITRVTEGYDGVNGLSTIAVYSQSTGKTVVYLHTDPLNSLKAGQTVVKGQQIATEAYRGASSTHTHVEVRNGRHTSAAKSLKDYTLENENPTSFWNHQGYSLK